MFIRIGILDKKAWFTYYYERHLILHQWPEVSGKHCVVFLIFWFFFRPHPLLSAFIFRINWQWNGSNSNNHRAVFVSITHNNSITKKKTAAGHSYIVWQFPPFISLTPSSNFSIYLILSFSLSLQVIRSPDFVNWTLQIKYPTLRDNGTLLSCIIWN